MERGLKEMSYDFTKFYEELWNLDQMNQGASVSARGENGGWINKEADVLLDEQYEVAGRNIDKAPNPLFFSVDQTILKAETYQRFIKLLNNYLINPLKKEDALGTNEQEDNEMNRFLDSVMDTQVAKRALVFLNAQLDKHSIEKVYAFIKKPVKSTLENDDFKLFIKLVWFDIYTNYFNGNPAPNCSGFEHVFVGEGKVNSNGIGGYHNWIKFYLDEVGKRVDFGGYNYDGNFQKEGTENPYVATIQMTWFLKDMYGNIIERKFKDKGGFFVGISPECQIVMGAVLLLENIAGFFTETNRPVEINGELYDFVLYRQSIKKNNDGMRIRSFYPIYKRPADISDMEKHYEILVDKGNIKVLSAYLNPRNSDRGRGWIEIHNNSLYEVSLNGWKLVDHHGNEINLRGEISPNKTRRLMVYKSNFSLNASGDFEIKNRESKVIFKLRYNNIKTGKVIYFK